MSGFFLAPLSQLLKKMNPMKFKFYSTLLAFLLIGTTQVFAQDKTNPDEKPVIILTPVGTPKLVMTETEHDFGTIVTGDTVSHVFRFVNEGSAPLVINHIKTPCGCTAPTWSRQPIAAGDTGEVTVKFNSKGKVGNQVKTLTIMYNSEMSPAMYTIKAFVKPPTN
ncbi:MAG: hypothetical protein ACI9JN_000328 [Bacteroidia bacterium]|jgi:hypothetical protein